MYEHKDHKNLFILDHPLIQHKLTVMRDKKCEQNQFTAALKEISVLMGYEVTRDLPLTTTTITTPMAKMKAPVLEGDHPAIVPILRAGLGMSEGLSELMPQAVIGHIGLYRDEQTLEPIEYLVKLPEIKNRHFYLVDPMFATGHSSTYAVDVLVRHGVSPDNISFMSLVSAPEGIEYFRKKYPNIPIYTASLDEKLDENAYIIPGLGDAGDRLFGTL